MIVASDHDNMLPTQDNPPPSYDLAVTDGAIYNGSSKVPVSDLKSRRDAIQPRMGQSSMTSSPSMTIYNYVNPQTHEHIASLLPPNHPEMVCLQQGAHVPQTRYGLLGVLAAVFWFPLGIGLCLLDRRVKCQRCGHMIDEGLF